MLANVYGVHWFVTIIIYFVLIKQNFGQSVANSSHPFTKVPQVGFKNVTKVHQVGSVNVTNSTINLPQGSFINLGGKQPASGDCFRQFAHLRERFNWEQLEFFCQKWRSYNEVIFPNFTNETEIPTPFTQNQRTYLNSLKVNIDSNDRDKYPKAVRKEYRSMSENERLLFIFAIRSLKRDKIDGTSKYDLIVTLRHPGLAPGAQVGAAFMPWHREYLRTFERALQQVNAFVSLPFWDTTIDEGLPDPSSSILWTDIFLGNGRGLVHSGPFADWSFEGGVNQTAIPLSRNINNGGKLMSEIDANFLRSRKSYREYTACVDLQFEQMIRGVHEWVGGTMSNIYYSPQDPLFFMFHAYVDSLWDDWRRSQSFEERTAGYPSDRDACTKYHYANSSMSPFEPLRNIDGLSDAYTDLYYSYQMRPTCNSLRPLCLSKYMVCDTKHNHCLSQIKTNGNCKNLEEFNPCYQSTCIDGVCVEKVKTKTIKTDHGIPIMNKLFIAK